MPDRFLMAALLLGLAADSQTLIDLRTQSKSIDFSNANTTKPFKSGTLLPSSCAVGEVFFKSDAVAGANLYACTAPDTWTVETGATGQSASISRIQNAGTNLPLQPTLNFLNGGCVDDPANGRTNCNPAGIAGVGIATDGANQGTQPMLNLISGNGITETCTNNTGNNRIDCTPSLNTAIALTIAAAQSGAPVYCRSTNGTTSYTCSLNSAKALTAYTRGMTLTVDVDQANTGPATINVDGLGNKSIRQSDGTTDPAAGQIAVNRPVALVYDGSVFRLPAYSGQGSCDSAHAISGTGTCISVGAGTVNSGASGQLGLYASSGNAVSGAGNANLNNGTLTLGSPNTILGALALDGSTSGSVTIQPQSAAGTYNFNLPVGAGVAGQPMLSGGGGSTPMSFGTLGVGAGGTGASSFTANAPLIGNGAGAIAAGSRSGNTTVFATTSGALTSGNCARFDANGNIVDNGSACGGGAGGVSVKIDGGTAAGPQAMLNFVPGTGLSGFTSAVNGSQIDVTLPLDTAYLNSNYHNLGGFGDWTEIALPGSSPPAGKLRVYAKTGVDQVCTLNSGGVETCLSAAGGAGAGTVNSGAAGQIAYYASSGSAVTGNSNAAMNNGVLTLGTPGSVAGGVTMEGGSSGAVTIQTQAAAGTYNFNLPSAAGASGQPLLSGGGGSSPMTFNTLGTGAGGTGLTTPWSRSFSLQAAGCNNTTPSSSLDLPTTNAPAPACHGTTYTWGTLDFDHASNKKASFSFRLPAGWTGAIDIGLDWYTPATTNNNKWTIETACLGEGTSDATAPSFNAAQTITTSSNGTANFLTRSTQAGVTTTGCSAGNVMILRIGRDVTDTNASIDSLQNIDVTLRVTPQA